MTRQYPYFNGEERKITSLARAAMKHDLPPSEAKAAMQEIIDHGRELGFDVAMMRLVEVAARLTYFAPRHETRFKSMRWLAEAFGYKSGKGPIVSPISADGAEEAGEIRRRMQGADKRADTGPTKPAHKT